MLANATAWMAWPHVPGKLYPVQSRLKHKDILTALCLMALDTPCQHNSRRGCQPGFQVYLCDVCTCRQLDVRPVSTDACADCLCQRDPEAVPPGSAVCTGGSSGRGFGRLPDPQGHDSGVIYIQHAPVRPWSLSMMAWFCMCLQVHKCVDAHV